MKVQAYVEAAAGGWGREPAFSLFGADECGAVRGGRMVDTLFEKEGGDGLREARALGNTAISRREG